MIMLVLPNAFGYVKRVNSNQTLVVEFYNDTGVEKHAFIFYPPGGAEPIPLGDVCGFPGTRDYPFYYAMNLDVDCNASTWDVGENLTLILNYTDQLYRWGKREQDDCNSAIKTNIELTTLLTSCQNKTAVLDTYSSLQSGYDVCSNDKRQAEEALTICTQMKDKAESEKFNYFIGGIICTVLVYAASNTKLFKSPAERNFVR